MTRKNRFGEVELYFDNTAYNDFFSISSVSVLKIKSIINLLMQEKLFKKDIFFHFTSTCSQNIILRADHPC